MDAPVVPRTKFPSNVHAGEGDAMPPHFFKNGKTIEIEVYLQILTIVVKPWMETVASGRPYIFQQDGAPAHTLSLIHI